MTSVSVSPALGERGSSQGEAPAPGADVTSERLTGLGWAGDCDLCLRCRGLLSRPGHTDRGHPGQPAEEDIGAQEM